MSLRIGDTTWTDERVASLTKLWAEGLSGSEIATQLGGITRNSVIGKVHRLGLPKREDDRAQPALPKKPRTFRTKPKFNGHVELGFEFEPIPEPTPDIATSPVTLLDLTDDTCRWPYGDPGTPDFHFCGGQSLDGPYCTRHARMAYMPLPSRSARYWNRGNPRAKAVAA